MDSAGWEEVEQASNREHLLLGLGVFLADLELLAGNLAPCFLSVLAEYQSNLLWTPLSRLFLSTQLVVLDVAIDAGIGVQKKYVGNA